MYSYMRKALNKLDVEGLDIKETIELFGDGITEGTQHYLDLLRVSFGHGIPELDLPMIVAALTIHATQLTKLMDKHQKDLTELIIQCTQTDVEVVKRKE